MRRKKPVTVAIIGGSVTAAYCKEPGIGCWVTPVTEWLLQENPQVHTALAQNLQFRKSMQTAASYNISRYSKCINTDHASTSVSKALLQIQF